MGKTKLTFEQALEKLERIVEQIEQSKVSLEESIDKYGEGMKLIKHCRQVLDAAEKKIQQLARGEDGKLQPAGELPETDTEGTEPPM